MPDINEAAIAALSAEVTSDLQPVPALVVNSPETLLQANALLKSVAQYKKRVEAEKSAITRPLLDALDRVRDLFRPAEEKIRAARAHLDKGLLDYDKELKDIEAKKTAALAKKVEQGKTTPEIAKAQVALGRVESNRSAIPTTTYKEVEVTDESLIPDEYWTLDTVKLRKVVLAGIAVPGTKIVEKTRIVGRS